MWCVLPHRRYMPAPCLFSQMYVLSPNAHPHVATASIFFRFVYMCVSVRVHACMYCAKCVRHDKGDETLTTGMERPHAHPFSLWCLPTALICCLCSFLVSFSLSLSFSLTHTRTRSDVQITSTGGNSMHTDALAALDVSGCVLVPPLRSYRVFVGLLWFFFRAS